MKNQLYDGFIAGKVSSDYSECKQPSTTLDNLSTMELLYNENSILGKLSDEVVMVDCDTADDSAALQRLLAAANLTVPSMQTNHGYHFYFLKSPHITSAFTGALTACGIVVDFKLGWRNGLDVVKIQGEWRKTFNDDAQLVPLPKFLKPVKTQGEGRVSFATLQKGFRNDTLFKFVGTLKRAGFTQDEANRLMRAINQNVLPEPLKIKDIDTIARPDAYENAFDAKPHFDPEAEADKLTAKYKFGVNADMLYQRQEGVYSPLTQVEIDRLIMENSKGTNIRSRKEVLAFVKAKARDLDLRYDTISNPELVPFNNGVLNMDTGNIITYDDCPQCFFSKIPHDFPTADVDCPVAEEFIRDITQGDNDLAELLFQIIGACIYRHSPLRGFFILIGPKANGKSTFLKWLNYILGNDNVSHIPLNQLGNQFSTKDLMGKMANLAEDISDTYISDATVIKSVTTSDVLRADVKFHEPLIFAPYCTMLFTANFLPNISDPTGAVQSRIIPVPFTADFLTSPITNMLEQLCTEQAAQWALLRGALAFNRARAAKSYAKPQCVTKTSDEYAKSNNPVLMFLSEYDDLELALNEADLNNIYSAFKTFCETENIQIMGRTKFTRRVKGVVKNLDSKRYRNTVTNSLGYKFVKIDSSKPLAL